VDLLRAERDTKIRARYLAALEQGDYRELPGAVYTKGFLRNYALYLGLDPDDASASGSASGAIPGSRRAGHRRPAADRGAPPGLTFSPGVVVAALLTVGVARLSAPTSASSCCASRSPRSSP
jgi:hypothetical protein